MSVLNRKSIQTTLLQTSYSLIQAEEEVLLIDNKKVTGRDLGWICGFIENNLTDWAIRITEIRKSKRGSLENFILRYGDTTGKENIKTLFYLASLI
jgi:hypothetical protein